MGKKIGIIALVCAIIYIVFSIIVITQAPEIPTEVYKLAATDQEAFQEEYKKIEDNFSALYKISGKVTTVVGIAVMVLAIISIVKMAKAKEKGLIMPIISIIIVVIFYFISVFSIANFGSAFQAGIEAGMEMQQQEQE